MTPLLVRGMGGLGDCLHQRAIVRQLLTRHEVWLETPWPSLYHDLSLHLLPLATKLRTQAKNMARETFTPGHPPAGIPVLPVSYTIAECQRSGILPAMCIATGCNPTDADFHLPIAPAWAQRADRLLRDWSPKKPVMIYRPLVERREWAGCRARNPDAGAYAALFDAIRQDFFVVSVADTDPEHEDIVSHDILADIECHSGELDIGTLAALTARAALTFCSPGFALILAQAVSTPVECVFGGYESAQRYLDTALYAPFLGVNPARPCNCFSFAHACDKRINLAAAIPEVQDFATAAARGFVAIARPTIAVPLPRRLPTPPRFMNAGELDTIIALLRRVAPRIVIEFGVNEGATAAALLKALPGVEHYVGVDVEPGYVTALAVQRAEVPQKPGHLAHSDSRFALLLRPKGSHDLTVEDLPMADAVFIDGDHSRAGVMQDTRLALARLRPGGIVVWHDDHDLGTVDVRDVLDELHAYGVVTACHVSGTWLAYSEAGGVR